MSRRRIPITKNITWINVIIDRSFRMQGTVKVEVDIFLQLMDIMKNRIALIMKLLMLMLVSCCAAAESVNSFGIGYEHTSGSYSLEKDTEITTIPFFAQYADNVWRVRISIPYISVTGDGSVIPGSHGGIPGATIVNATMGPGSGTSAAQNTTQSGIGDIVMSASYMRFPKRGSFWFYELTAEIKWGTASVSKNLGTGQDDSSLSLYSMYDKYDLKPYFLLGRLVTGDSDLVNYNDVFFVRLGSIYQLDQQTSFDVSYDYEQAAISGVDNRRMARLYVTRLIDHKWSAGIYLLKGFTNSVADNGFGFTVMKSFR